MILTSTATTARLEARARARGKHWGIIRTADNARGRYFVTSADNQALPHGWPLGWTREQAELTIDALEGP